MKKPLCVAALALGITIGAACAAPDAEAQTLDPFGAWRSFLDCTIDHESRSAGVYATNTGNGYFGAFQFVSSTWAGAISRAGYPLLAMTPPVEPTIPAFFQDAAAVQLASERGAQPWGNRCSGLLP